MKCSLIVVLVIFLIGVCESSFRPVRYRGYGEPRNRGGYDREGYDKEGYHSGGHDRGGYGNGNGGYGGSGGYSHPHKTTKKPTTTTTTPEPFDDETTTGNLRKYFAFNGWEWM